MNKFQKFLKSKNISQEEFEKMSAEETAKLQAEFYSEELKNTASKKDLETLKEEVGKLPKSEAVSKLQKDVEDALESIAKLKDKGFSFGGASVQKQVNDFIEENFDKINQIKSQGTGIVEFTVKAPESITTGSATNPDGIPQIAGVQQAGASNVNLRGTFIESLTSNVNTSLTSYPYSETLPKDGDFSFVAEGAEKPQTDFKIETRYASPSKIAAWIRLTDESVKDVAGIQSIATDFLRKKHDLKKQKELLFGDGVSPNPKGATEYARAFNVGAMANSVVNPNFMDVVNSVVTDVFTTRNYEDETGYLPSLVVVNPVDFFIQFTAAKDGDGKPLYPTASLFNRVTIGQMTIIPEMSIPAGKVFVADMSKYNTTNYVGYTVKIGWVNDDFIRNQFVILGESRFHAFVKKLDENAFVYDDIETIKTAITKA